MRTVPERIYDAKPRGEFTILESYVRALQSAQSFIYIENQFLWSPEIEAVLHEKIADPPHPDFRLVLLLPSKPNSGADDTRGVLGHLIAADDDAGRVLACTLFARAGDLADPIYVHAKIAVVDDAWFTIGSANLNEHSLFNDTEMNIVSRDPSWPAGPVSVSGPSISSCPRIRSRPIRSRRSTSCGSRSARSSSSAATRAFRSRTGSSGSPTSHGARRVRSGPFRGSSSTADPVSRNAAS